MYIRFPSTRSVIMTNPTCATNTDRKYFASGKAWKGAVSGTGSVSSCDSEDEGFEAGRDPVDSRSLPRSESSCASVSSGESDFGANSGILPRSRSIEAFDLVLRRLLIMLVPARCQWSEAGTDVGEWDEVHISGAVSSGEKFVSMTMTGRTCSSLGGSSVECREFGVVVEGSSTDRV